MYNQWYFYLLSLYILSGVLSVIYAMRLRKEILKYNNDYYETSFNKCTLIHLYSHKVLIISYIIVSSYLHYNY